MKRSPIRPSHLVFLAFLCSTAAGNALCDAQRVITDDGREVLLRDDGTWEFLSTDRLADTREGRRVRLKQDGTWVYEGNTPVSSDDQVRTVLLSFELRNVVIEKEVEKVQKNRRVSSRMVFNAHIALSPAAESPLRIDGIDTAAVTVQDSENKVYSVTSIEPQSAIIEPGARMTLTVRVDGAPLFWENPDTMRITFQPPLFGLREPITLTRDLDDIDTKEVDKR